MKRGQGTFEYVVLAGGVLVIIVLATVMLRGIFTQQSQGIQKTVMEDY